MKQLSRTAASHTQYQQDGNNRTPASGGTLLRRALSLNEFPPSAEMENRKQQYPHKAGYTDIQGRHGIRFFQAYHKAVAGVRRVIKHLEDHTNQVGFIPPHIEGVQVFDPVHNIPDRAAGVGGASTPPAVAPPAVAALIGDAGDHRAGYLNGVFPLLYRYQCGEKDADKRNQGEDPEKLLCLLMGSGSYPFFVMEQPPLDGVHLNVQRSSELYNTFSGLYVEI